VHFDELPAEPEGIGEILGSGNIVCRKVQQDFFLVLMEGSMRRIKAFCEYCYFTGEIVYLLAKIFIIRLQIGHTLRQNRRLQDRLVSLSLEHDFGCGAAEHRFGYKNAGA
jgi:hypothetical protein